MYLPSLIDRVGLFKGLGGWPTSVDGQRPSLLNQALFRATAILVQLQLIHDGEGFCRAQFERVREQLDLKGDRIGFWSPSIVGILTALSSGFASVRALQDCLPRLTGQTLGVGGVPQSMNDFKRLRRSDLPSRHVDLFHQYWINGGERMKHYRDLDVHHWSIVEHCYLHLVEPPRVLVLLPDDPEILRRADQTFSKHVDGISVLQHAVRELDALVTELCEELGGTPRRPPLTITLEQFGDLRKGVSQTIAVVVNDQEGNSGVILGHTSDRQVSARQFVVRG